MVKRGYCGQVTVTVRVEGIGSGQLQLIAVQEYLQRCINGTGSPPEQYRMDVAKYFFVKWYADMEECIRLLLHINLARRASCACGR